MTGSVPQNLMLMIFDAQSAGRIVVDLGAFVRFHLELDSKLEAFEERVMQEIPQLRERRTSDRGVRSEAASGPAA
jgi:hypothetical protein